MPDKLYRIKKDDGLFGVCTGVAEYTGASIFCVRMLCVALCFSYGVGVLLYFALALFLPLKES